MTNQTHASGWKQITACGQKEILFPSPTCRDAGSLSRVALQSMKANWASILKH